MSRYTGEKDGYAEGLEKILLITNNGSSKAKKVDKQMAFCKHCRDEIEDNHAVVVNCKPWPYLLHTGCEYDCYQSSGNKCPLCKKTPHSIPVKLIPVQKPTKEKKRWLNIFRMGRSEGK